MPRQKKSLPRNRLLELPNWRWVEGQALAQSDDRRLVSADPHIAAIANYLRASADSMPPADDTHTALAAVEAIQRDPRLSRVLKILVIAGTPAVEISHE